MRRQRTLHQRGGDIMAQRTREFQLQAGKEAEPLTSWGGVLPLCEFYRKTGMAGAVDRMLGLRPEQGYPDSFMIGSLMLLSWCGYEAPEQISGFWKGTRAWRSCCGSAGTLGRGGFVVRREEPSRRRRRSGRICMNSRTTEAGLREKRRASLFRERQCETWEQSTGSS